eukprot:6819952-Prymnesium_polylepis.1
MFGEVAMFGKTLLATVVHGNAPHKENRSARWFTPQGDSVNTHALLASNADTRGRAALSSTPEAKK